MTYPSQNRAKPGSGTAGVFACGLSGLLETSPFDYVRIAVDSGPCAGYSNLGFLQNGTLVVR